MKKIYLLLLIVLIPSMIMAKEYYIKDINYKINIDENYMVFTRDNLENNEELKSLGITVDRMKTIMSNSNIYLDIIDKSSKKEILLVVPKKEITINNYSNFPNNFLESSAKLYAENVGAEKYDTYKAKHNFITVDYYDSKTGYYIVNYYTVVNAKGYNLQLQKTTPITDDEKAELRTMVESINIEILDDYKVEKESVQKAINDSNKSGFNWKRIIVYMVIGAIVGGLSSLIGLLVKKHQKAGE